MRLCHTAHLKNGAWDALKPIVNGFEQGEGSCAVLPLTRHQCSIRYGSSRVFLSKSSGDCRRWPGRGGQSHFFRIQLRSCSQIFESGSGIFSNLRIRLLFRLQVPSIQPKFTHVFT